MIEKGERVRGREGSMRENVNCKGKEEGKERGKQNKTKKKHQEMQQMRTLSFSEFKISALISFSLASFTAGRRRLTVCSNHLLRPLWQAAVISTTPT